MKKHTCCVLLLNFLLCLNSFGLGDQPPIKILTIGNSFSEDAVENYLYDLAKFSGKDIVIGNLYIPGCSLETHLYNMKNDNKSYSYRKTNGNGEIETYPDASILDALNDENWDYVSFQQASHLSGKYSTWQASLPELYEMVKENSNNPNREYIIHQTWAYQQNSDHHGFANYNKSQKLMYDSIVIAVCRISNSMNLPIIVPTGTAIQNARSSILGDNLCRDGYHLNLDYGRFTAAATWFQKIFDTDIRTVEYTPYNLTEKESEIAKKSAYYAVKNPITVTEIKCE